MKKIAIFFTLITLLLYQYSYANLVFPAIADQFAVGTIVPFYYSIVLAVLILSIEAFFIKRLFLINNIRSFIISFIINFISSVAGTLWAALTFGAGQEGFLAILKGYEHTRIGTYLGLIPGYLFTFIFEGFLLILIGVCIKNKIGLKRAFKTSVLMNLYSYVILLIGIFIADIISKGRVFTFR